MHAARESLNFREGKGNPKSKIQIHPKFLFPKSKVVKMRLMSHENKLIEKFMRVRGIGEDVTFGKKRTIKRVF